MAEFKSTYQLLNHDEGDWNLDPDDPGGETYKGVSRKLHGKWSGWIRIDMLKRQPGFPANLERDIELQEMVEEFYEVEFWNRISGSLIQEQAVANSIFDFAVNAGVSTSNSLAQLVVGAKPDGVIGPKSIEMINGFNKDHFLAAFTVAKIARYIHIVKKRPLSRKYFYGWILRALDEN